MDQDPHQNQSLPHYPSPNTHIDNDPVQHSDELNAMALAGFVSAFIFFPVGFVLSWIGLKQIKRTGERGRPLAIAGLIVSGISLLAIPVGIALALLINTQPQPTQNPNNDSSLSSQEKARNTERETDINVLQAQLEESFQLTAYYPTLNQLNDELWRHSYMPDLDLEALFDPMVESFNLSATPAANTYAYEVFPYGCDNTDLICDRYILTATLDGGGTYTRSTSDNWESQ